MKADLRGSLLALALSLLALPAQAQDLRRAPRLDVAARGRIERSGVVGRAVVEGLERGERVRVMVLFEVPEASGERGGARFLTPAVRASLRERATALLARLAPGDFELRHRFGTVNALAGDVNARGLLALAEAAGVLRVDLELDGRGGLAQSVPLAGLDAAQGAGYGGEGVQVAVLDSGFDSSHADLAGAVIAEECFCTGGCCPDASSRQGGAGSAEDDNGHGTNVTGIVTGDGVVASVGGAPDAEIVAIKVLDSDNAFCCASDVIMALDWIVTDRPDVDVVNMSLGTSALFLGDCDGANATTSAFATVINTLRADGTLSVVSSMNNGSGTRMAAPACVANAISVGAVWDANVGSQTILGCTDATTAADKVTCFSNSNARTDLFAPGAPITASGIGGGTGTYYGTSQAAPHVAACTAALRQKSPLTAADDLEAALESSLVSVTDVTNGLSFPRLDCEQALAQLPTSVPSLSPPGVALLGALILAIALAVGRWREGLGRGGEQRQGATADAPPPRGLPGAAGGTDRVQPVD